VIVAVRATLRDCRIPVRPLLRLLEAFRRDVSFTPPTNWDDVLTYCSFSANPIGELFLYLDHDGEPISDSTRAASDAICSALQITNFLQDLASDRARGREYLPISLENVISHTHQLYRDGAVVAAAARSLRVRLELRAIIAGGKTMLELCERRKDPLERPAITLHHLPLLVSQFFRLA
jgi:phytoene/squalene synthetase